MKALDVKPLIGNGYSVDHDHGGYSQSCPIERAERTWARAVARAEHEAYWRSPEGVSKLEAHAERFREGQVKKAQFLVCLAAVFEREAAREQPVKENVVEFKRPQPPVVPVCEPALALAAEIG